jgi:hypothetical protein
MFMGLGRHKLIGGVLFCLFFLSAGAFVFGQTITVTSPEAGDTWYKGATYTITWTRSGTMAAHVNIRLRDEAGTDWAHSIADNVSNNGSFSFTVPPTIPDGGYRVRIATVDRNVSGRSEVFRIRSAKTLPPREVSRLAADYGIENISIRSLVTGKPSAKIGGSYYFHYSGDLTPGTASVRVRWNRSAPPAGCRVRVELEQEYLSGGRSVLGPFDVPAFDDRGNADVSFPFTIRAGERFESQVMMRARLLFSGGSGCDSDHRNNTFNAAMTLREHVGTIDLALHLKDADFKLTRVLIFVSAGSVKDYYFKHVARVKNFGSAYSLRNVKVQYEVFYGYLDRPEIRRLITRRFFTFDLVGRDWALEPFSNHDDFGGDMRVPIACDVLYFVVEVDPDHELADSNRTNNRQIFRIRLD